MLRRDVLGLLSVLGAATLGEVQGAESPAKFRVPRVEFLYECDVTLTEPQPFGATPQGLRKIIPITGGRFQGPRMRGTVVSGGADWNLTRADGAGSVEADYYLRTDDGVTLRIVNKGVGGGDGPPVTDGATGETFFMFTTPVIEAPTGKYDWLNRSVLVATLGARRDARNAVLIRAFQLV